jgi:hypothetical protein
VLIVNTNVKANPASSVVLVVTAGLLAFWLNVPDHFRTSLKVQHVDLTVCKPALQPVDFHNVLVVLVL